MIKRKICSRKLFVKTNYFNFLFFLLNLALLKDSSEIITKINVLRQFSKKSFCIKIKKVQTQERTHDSFLYKNAIERQFPHKEFIFFQDNGNPSKGFAICYKIAHRLIDFLDLLFVLIKRIIKINIRASGNVKYF